MSEAWDDAELALELEEDDVLELDDDDDDDDGRSGTRATTRTDGRSSAGGTAEPGRRRPRLVGTSTTAARSISTLTRVPGAAGRGRVGRDDLRPSSYRARSVTTGPSRCADRDHRSPFGSGRKTTPSGRVTNEVSPCSSTFARPMNLATQASAGAAQSLRGSRAARSPRRASPQRVSRSRTPRRRRGSRRERSARSRRRDPSARRPAGRAADGRGRRVARRAAAPAVPARARGPARPACARRPTVSRPSAARGPRARRGRAARRPAPRPSSASALHPQAEGDVLGNVPVREQCVVLEHEADAPPVGRYAGERAAAERHRTAVEALEAGDHPEQGGLAAAARAEHGDDRAPLDPEVDPVERGMAAEHDPGADTCEHQRACPRPSANRSATSAARR